MEAGRLPKLALEAAGAVMLSITAYNAYQAVDAHFDIARTEKIIESHNRECNWPFTAIGNQCLAYQAEDETRQAYMDARREDRTFFAVLSPVSLSLAGVFAGARIAIFRPERQARGEQPNNTHP